MSEVWKPLTVKGFEDLYFISNTGLIKNKRGRIRKLTMVYRKHAVITLCKKDKTNTYIVKNLVAKHFIPNPNNLNMVVNLDGNILNNATYNLRWAKKIVWNYGMKESIEQTLGFQIKTEIRRHGGREQLLTDLLKKECRDEMPQLIEMYDRKSQPLNIFDGLCEVRPMNYSLEEMEAVIYRDKK